MRLTRLALIAAVIALALVLAPDALAAAGGGSGGFGGGGGGGGGGYSGGGGGYGGSGGRGGFSFVAVLIVLGVFAIFLVPGAIATMRYNQKRHSRARRVRRASAEAAEDDAYLGHDAVQADTKALFAQVQQAWDARDRDTLNKLVGPDLMVEWTRRLDNFEKKGWHNRVSILEGPSVEYVGLVNREDDDYDRVVVRVQAKLKDFVENRQGNVVLKKGESSQTSKLKEYWTLARSGNGWMVVSIEQDREGRHQLDEKIVASPWSDDQRLHDEAVYEQAAADKLPEGFTPADAAEVDFVGDARSRALDLSLADARFAPDVLETAARQAVEAWAEAVDGPDQALEKVASPEAVRKLLYAGKSGGKTRLVVRGPRIRKVSIEDLDPNSEPATMILSVEVFGRRYTEDRDTTTVVSGSKDRATTFTEHWTLALQGPDDAPWRLVKAGRRTKAA
jgi:predicted lipid-binding transport protein (Tim44 family)